jgi:hypothetical protein
MDSDPGGHCRGWRGIHRSSLQSEGGGTMAEMKTGYLKVQYKDGTMQRFEYARAEEKTNIAERIKEMLQTGTLLLQIPSPNRLLVIPFSSIQSIEVVPPPPKMPGIVIKVMREMEQP